MATYYVRKTGNDANAGTSAGAAWLTIGKALGAAGIASGDTVYVGPGTYRETVAIGMTSAVAETRVIADIDGSHTGDAPGPVVWTAYGTNDTTAPSGNSLLTMQGRDHLTFQNLIMIGGSANPSVIQAQTTLCTDITFRDCFLMSMKNATCVASDNVTATAYNWLYDRCMIHGNIYMYCFTSTSADYDIGIEMRNCFCYNDGGISLTCQATGANSFKPGGVKVLGCTFIGGNYQFYLNTTNWSTSIKSVVYNCIFDCNNGIASDAANTITEDYNYFFCSSTVRSNVTAGANSQSYPTYAPLFGVGNELQWGQVTRPPWTPLLGSPMLGFGNGTGVAAVDFLNRPRPAGGPLTKAVGYMERHDTAVKETGTTQASGVAIAITGPGDHEFLVPVDAISTTISIYGRYDTNHATTNKPQMQLVANGEIGFAGETKTMTVTTDTWEQITFSAFTPSAKGVVRLRVISRSAAANGKAFFDTLAVA